MLDWLGSAIQDVGTWFGSGVMSIISWLLSGILSILTKVIRAVGGVFGLLDAVYEFFVSIKDAILGLLPALFPWIPEDVMTVISLGLLAILLAAFVKRKG